MEFIYMFWWQQVPNAIRWQKWSRSTKFIKIPHMSTRTVLQLKKLIFLYYCKLTSALFHACLPCANLWPRNICIGWPMCIMHAAIGLESHFESGLLSKDVRHFDFPPEDKGRPLVNKSRTTHPKVCRKWKPSREDKEQYNAEFIVTNINCYKTFLSFPFHIYYIFIKQFFDFPFSPVLGFPEGTVLLSATVVAA